MGGLDELAVIQFVPITAKRIITRGYSIKDSVVTVARLFYLRRAQIRIIFCRTAMLTKRPNHNQRPEIFGWRWRIFASITALTLASFSAVEYINRASYSGLAR